MRKPKTILVPLGYPDYPRDVVKHFIDVSEKMVDSLGIEVITTKHMTNLADVEEISKQLREIDFDYVTALLPSWLEASNGIAVLKDVFHKPILLWSHTTYMDGNKKIFLGPLPAAGVLRETFEEMGLNFKFVYGMPKSDKYKTPDSKKLEREMWIFANAARASRLLSNSIVGLFGYISMAMYTGSFDHIQLRRKIGPEVRHLGQCYIIERMKEFSDDDVKNLVKKAKEEWLLSENVTDKDIIKTMKMYRALKSLAEENRFDIITVKCQYELSRLYKFTPCIPLSFLGDEVATSCEGDVYSAVTQLILRYLSSGKPTTFGDVFEVFDNGIILGHCGFAPLSMQKGNKPEITKHTALYEGLNSSSPYKDGEITIARLAKLGENFKMHIMTGEITPAEQPLYEIGCPSYVGSMSKIILDGNVDSFMQNMMSQHYCFVYGNVKGELVELCKILGIKTVFI